MYGKERMQTYSQGSQPTIVNTHLSFPEVPLSSSIVWTTSYFNLGDCITFQVGQWSVTVVMPTAVPFP